MGLVLSYMYEIGALTVGLCGITRGWHLKFNEELNRMTNNSLDRIVANSPSFARSFARTSVEIMPYSVALYTAIEVGGKIARLM